MGDTFNVNNSPGSSFGNQAQTTNYGDVSSYYIPKDLDFEDLVNQLQSVKKEIDSHEDSPEKKAAAENIDKAIDVAVKKDANGVVYYLKKGGEWIGHIALHIGAATVAELIRHNVFA
jgi:hypothetical protein